MEQKPYILPVEHTAHITWAYEHAFEALTDDCRDLALQITGFLQCQKTFNHPNAAQLKLLQNRILSDDPTHLRRKDLIRFLVRVVKEIPAECLQEIVEPIQDHIYPPNVLKEILSARLLEEQYIKRQISGDSEVRFSCLRFNGSLKGNCITVPGHESVLCVPVNSHFHGAPADLTFDFAIECQEYSAQGQAIDVESTSLVASGQWGLFKKDGYLHDLLRHSNVLEAIRQDAVIGRLWLLVAVKSDPSTCHQAPAYIYLTFSIKMGVSASDRPPASATACCKKEVPNLIARFERQKAISNGPQC